MTEFSRDVVLLPAVVFSRQRLRNLQHFQKKKLFLVFPEELHQLNDGHTHTLKRTQLTHASTEALPQLETAGGGRADVHVRLHCHSSALVPPQKPAVNLRELSNV